MKKAISIFLSAIIMVSGISFTVSAKSVKVPSPKIRSITAIDTTTLKIKWSKVKGAKGYVLYCKKSGSKFKRLKTFSKKTTSYTHKRLTVGKKYFYKLKAYKKVKGKKKYSKYSNTRSLKCNNYLVNLYSPYQKFCFDEYKNGATFSMGGDKYGNGFTLNNPGAGNAIYNLKGKYKHIILTVGNIDGCTETARISILSDDYCVGTYEVKANSLPRTIKVNIENATKLEFKINTGWNYVGFANIKLYK